jgi:hypothetical protein
MNTNYVFCLATLLTCLHCVADTELSYQIVAVTGQPAPGLSSNLTFSGFAFIALTDDGRPGVGAHLQGPGVNYTNSLGLWSGQPLSLGRY